MRKFETGATRDTEVNKLDYEGFLSPAVVERYAKYMDSHRKQGDGQLRASDNWQRGIPVSVYQKSLVRHLIQAWGVWRANRVLDDRGAEVGLEDSLCGILFNTSGYLHELLKQNNKEVK
jgi:hypothetical protein